MLPGPVGTWLPVWCRNVHPRRSKACRGSRPEDDRQLSQRLRYSTVGTVSGKPTRTHFQARHDGSRMLARASSSVPPWLTQPGMTAHSATIMPVSSRSNVTWELHSLSCTIAPASRHSTAGQGHAPGVRHAIEPNERGWRRCARCA